jgi:cell wall-associated NlpC family hydrolase
LSKHRRPSVWRLGRRPLHVGVAAGVASTVAVTGTLVASAAPSTEPSGPSGPSGQHGGATAASAASLVTGATLADLDKRAAAEGRSQARALVIDRREAAEQARRAAEAQAARRAVATRKAAQLKAAKRRADAARSLKRSSRSEDEPMSASAASVLAIAAAQQGDRYRHGGDGPDTFDCSGFTQYVFGKVGISLPHSSAAQRAVARRISADEVRPGDLVFVYNGGGGRVGHVAIYGGRGLWYEASNPGRPVGANRPWSSNVSYGRVL